MHIKNEEKKIPGILNVICVPKVMPMPNFKLVYAYFLLLHLDNYTLKLINPDDHS
jgi:hypothetical protein